MYIHLHTVFRGGAGDTVQQGSGKDIIDSLELTS